MDENDTHDALTREHKTRERCDSIEDFCLQFRNAIGCLMTLREKGSSATMPQ